MKQQVPGTRIYATEKVIAGCRVGQRQQGIATLNGEDLGLRDSGQHISLDASADGFGIGPDHRLEHILSTARGHDGAAGIKVDPEPVHNAPV